MIQVIYSEELDLVKPKRFSSYEYICEFENFNSKLLDRNQFYSALRGGRMSNKGYNNVLKV